MTPPPGPRLNLVDPEKADPDKDGGALLGELARTTAIFDKVPNVFRVAANSTPALTALNGLFECIHRCSIPSGTALRLGLALATKNKCGYCVRAHAALAADQGLSADEIDDARGGRAADPKTQAALDLALELNRTHGLVDDALLEKTRAAGFSDEEIVDIILVTSQNLFTHMLNGVAKTPCEFPEVPSLNE